MGSTEQQQKQDVPETWQGSRKEETLAQLEHALALQPKDAEQWCRLGELYEALASDARTQEAAGAYREKAVAALTKAIGLCPSLGKAHFVLANVYRAYDMCLALLEFEAAAKCDPEAYGEALARAQQAVRDSTYRLADLKLFVLESAQEKPGPEILRTEFYFEDRTIRSAVLHTCASKEQRQCAKAWLFESETLDADVDPVAQVTINATGNVFVSKGCPAKYPVAKPRVKTSVREEMPAVTPSRDAAVKAPVQLAGIPPARTSSRPRGRRSGVWTPLGLLIAAFGGSLFAYTTLLAPPPASSPAPVIAAPAVSLATDPVEDDPLSVPASLQDQRWSVPRERTLAPSRESITTETPRRAPLQRPLAREHTVAATGRTQEQTAPLPVVQKEGQAIAPPATTEPASVSPPMAKEQPAVIASVQKDEAAPLPAVRKQTPAVPAIQTGPPAAANNWQRRMRAELDACGKPGFWKSDICRETTRWNYCHPNRWNAVPECMVERFASSAVSN